MSEEGNADNLKATPPGAEGSRRAEAPASTPSRPAEKGRARMRSPETAKTPWERAALVPRDLQPLFEQSREEILDNFTKTLGEKDANILVDAVDVVEEFKGKALSEEDITQIAQRLSHTGMKREHANGWLLASDFSDAEKAKILEKIDPLTDEEKADNEGVDPEELTQLDKNAEEKMGEAAAAIADAQKRAEQEKDPLIQGMLKDIAFHTQRKFEQLEHWFKAPPKEWGKRALKGLAISAFIAFVLLILTLRGVGKIGANNR